MRCGKIVGRVTLSSRLPDAPPGCYVIVQPEDAAALQGASATAETVVAFDERSAADGDRIALAEGREAAMPFHPRRVPFDAYCAAIMDSVRVEFDDKRGEQS